MTAPTVEELLARGILVDPDVAGRPDLLAAASALLEEEPDRLVIDLAALEAFVQRQPPATSAPAASPPHAAGSLAAQLPPFQHARTSPALHPDTPHAAGDAIGAAMPLPGAALAEAAAPIRILSCYTTPSHKRSCGDFVGLFNRRFAALEGLLRHRSELAGLTTITRLKMKSERDTGAVIGMVADKAVTAKKHLLLTLEDPTGTVKALVNANRADAYQLACDLAFDEVIGAVGTWARGLFMVDSLFIPDVPAHREVRKGPEDVYVAFVGDVHVGAKAFLQAEFEHMLAWLRGKAGSAELRALAAKVKYVCFLGDLVEGLGIYQGQEADLTIPDIFAQYRAFVAYAAQIPPDKRVVIIPGNHDAGRISEPQPPLDKDLAPELYALPHFTLLSNPCLFTIGATPAFAGLDVLLYHGYSLIYYANAIDSIRSKGGMTRIDLVMEYLLRHRHLAPTHGSNLYVPDPQQDALVIDRLPDLFVTGHIHRVSVRTYRGTTLINASAWVDETDYQQKQGLIPQPARLPLVNLMTRQVRILNFHRQPEPADEEAA